MLEGSPAPTLRHRHREASFEAATISLTEVSFDLFVFVGVPLCLKDWVFLIFVSIRVNCFHLSYLFLLVFFSLVKKLGFSHLVSFCVKCFHLIYLLWVLLLRFYEYIIWDGFVYEEFFIVRVFFFVGFLCFIFLGFLRFAFSRLVDDLLICLFLQGFSGVYE